MKLQVGCKRAAIVWVMPTHFVSSTKLTATLDARFLRRNVGSYALYVVNPGPHGNVSTAGYFLVNFKD